MQNAPAMLAQKMMNRQAAYAPVGMVSQNMSGNKKGAAAGGGGGGGPVIGLKFNTTNATSGVAFSNSDTTATNSSAGAIASAKANAGIVPNTTNYWYWEFTVGTANSMFMGVGLPTFVCDAANRVGIIANSVAYRPDNGILQAAGATLTTVSSARVGDVIGFKLEVFNPGSSLTVIKNGTVLINQIDISAYVTDNSVAWTPIFSANVTTASATISNNIYEYAGFIPVGTVATTIAASASVTPVADGKYDVYTFNASGTFTVASTGAVRALVIAGGGGGGGTGGGGAGGYQEKGVVTTPQTYTITVGSGGAGNGTGANSSIGSTLVSNGGGGGSGAAGGSGGGASPALGVDNTVPGGTGISGQGFNGGSGGYTTTTADYGGGGGGGAGAVGGNGFAAGGAGGNGGAGLSSDITGTATLRGGGGGGFGDITLGTGGSGGGANAPAINAVANKGGGGGGSGGTAQGGSGVVIIRVRARA